MHRRTQLNLALVAAAGLLTAALWLTQPEPPAAPEALLDIAREDIQRIEIHPGGDTRAVVLVRRPGGWRLASPVKARANENRIDMLLEIAALAPQRRYAASAVDAEQAGLARPVAAIRFNDAPALTIGAYAPTTTGPSKRYVRIGDTVALAPIPNAGLLDLPWPQWIDPHLLAPDGQLTALHLPAMTLTRAATGGWRVRPASRDRGADAAQFTVDAWRHARALSITAAKNDVPAMAAIELVFAHGRTRRLEVVARRPQLILRDPKLGIAYHLSAGMAAPLLDMRHPASSLAPGNGTAARERQARGNQAPANRGPQ